MNRNRTNSLANSASSTNSSSLYPSNSFISPLIKLERLVYRLNSILSINLEALNEFELEKHLKLLLEVIINLTDPELHLNVAHVKHFLKF